MRETSISVRIRGDPPKTVMTRPTTEIIRERVELVTARENAQNFSGSIPSAYEAAERLTGHMGVRIPPTGPNRRAYSLMEKINVDLL